MTRVVIVGGVAGGATAAARLRRLREDFEIVVLERGPYVSFANCGLPYYVGDMIQERRELELMTPKRFLNRFNINIRVNHEALAIDRSSKTITVKNLDENQNYELLYDLLLLSPGAYPIKPPIPGLSEVPLFFLRTIPDAEAIRQYIEKHIVKHGIIVGGGFIGLEMAENLRKRNLYVEIVEMLNQVMPPLDPEMAQFIHQELIRNDVGLVLGDAVDSFGRTDKGTPFVKTISGKIIETDLIMMSIGVKPESRLAREANLEVGPGGHIIVDERMQTSDPSIYAVGDAIQIINFVTKEPTSIPLAGPANKQGRIAADNMAGRDSKYRGTLGASVVQVFDLTVASVGPPEKVLKKLNIQIEKVYLFPSNHAGYYPGAVPMAFKLLFKVPSGKVLGAQIVGKSGSEKRIDVISTLMKMGGTVFDLEELELSYAPPYNSAKDPVNMAGFIASNVLRGDMPIFHWHDVEEIENRNGYFLDVRTAWEYNNGSFKNAINISDMQLRKHLNEIPKDRAIYVFCEQGFRGYLATRTLMQHGYEEVYNLTGGHRIHRIANAAREKKET